MDKSLNKVIKKHIVLTVLTGIAIVLMMITITYGLYQTNHENTTDQEISLGDFDVDLTSSSGQITLSDINPGVENSATYTFTTSNSGDYTVKYSVYFTDNTSVFLADSTNAQNYSSYSQITSQNYKYIEYKLDSSEYRPLSDVYNSSTGRFTILGGRLYSGESYTHTVKFKVASNAPNDIQGSILALSITMEASASNEVGADKIKNIVKGSPINSPNVITKTAPTGSTCTNTLAYDNTADNNLRYVGANPCNYVTFNGEEAGWRIIGVMNNIDDGTGNLETRIKLVRKDALGSYSWDTSPSSVNYGFGVNDWTQADLMQELNGDYLNTNLTENTYWYKIENDNKTEVYDYTKGLKTEAQSLIANTKWRIGGWESPYINTGDMYNKERGTNVPSTSTPYIWTGKVALIYPSDYSFAMNPSNISRTTCINANYDDFKNSEYSECKNSSYIFSSVWQWTLTPKITRQTLIYTINANGAADGTNAYGISTKAGDVRPSVYLKSGVLISSGDGSEENPYNLQG